MRSAGVGQDVRYRLLEPLRGLAALWVFAYHYDFSPALRGGAPWLADILATGYLGVPMFFVISGYCMIASLRLAIRYDEPASAFLRRRALRIYPPYWCSIVVVAALPFIVEALSALKTGHYVEPTAVGNTSLGFLNYGLGDWLRVATLTQAFVPLNPWDPQSLQFKFTSINAVYWTLAIEMQFYLVMAVAVGLRRRAIQWLALVTALSGPIAYAGAWRTAGIFLPYWPMFAVGAALCLVLERQFTCARMAGRWHRLVAALCIPTIIALFAGSVWRSRVADEWQFAVGFAVVLWFLHEFDDAYVSGLRAGTRITRFSVTTLKYLGLMSYSLYLLHGRLQFLAHQIARQILPRGLLLDLTVIAFTCSLCFVFYYICERPFIRTRQRSVAAPRQAEGVVALAG